MAEQRLKFKITGTSGLIVHNGQTADPMNRYAKMMKQISGKRSKTEADFAEMARIEWFASHYTDKGRSCIPGIVWESCIGSAARKIRLGQQVQAGLVVPGTMLIDFPHKDMPLEDIWNDEEIRELYRFTVGVRVQRNKVMRTRCKFDEWGGVFEVVFNDTVLNKSQVIEIMGICGELTGLCDWRPRFGRFNAEVVKTESTAKAA